MKSDTELYKIFKSIPEFFALLAPIDPNDEYTFSAPVLKDLVRHYDGYLEPKNPTAPGYVIEFQAQSVPEIYPRVFIQMGLSQLDNMQREIRGLLIFPTRSIDPKLRGWTGFRDT